MSSSSSSSSAAAADAAKDENTQRIKNKNSTGHDNNHTNLQKNGSTHTIQNTEEAVLSASERKVNLLVMVSAYMALLAYTAYQIYLVINGYRNPTLNFSYPRQVPVPMPSVLICPFDSNVHIMSSASVAKGNMIHTKCTYHSSATSSTSTSVKSANESTSSGNACDVYRLPFTNSSAALPFLTSRCLYAASSASFQEATDSYTIEYYAFDSNPSGTSTAFLQVYLLPGDPPPSVDFNAYSSSSPSKSYLQLIDSAINQITANLNLSSSSSSSSSPSTTPSTGSPSTTTAPSSSSPSSSSSSSSPSTTTTSSASSSPSSSSSSSVQPHAQRPSPHLYHQHQAPSPSSNVRSSSFSSSSSPSFSSLSSSSISGDSNSLFNILDESGLIVNKILSGNYWTDRCRVSLSGDTTVFVQRNIYSPLFSRNSINWTIDSVSYIPLATSVNTTLSALSLSIDDSNMGPFFNPNEGLKIYRSGVYVGVLSIEFATEATSWTIESPTTAIVDALGAIGGIFSVVGVFIIRMNGPGPYKQTGLIHDLLVHHRSGSLLSCCCRAAQVEALEKERNIHAYHDDDDNDDAKENQRDKDKRRANHPPPDQQDIATIQLTMVPTKDEHNNYDCDNDTRGLFVHAQTNNTTHTDGNNMHRSSSVSPDPGSNPNTNGDDGNGGMEMSVMSCSMSAVDCEGSDIKGRSRERKNSLSLIAAEFHNQHQ